jgi:hypothetical protein
LQKLIKFGFPFLFISVVILIVFAWVSGFADDFLPLNISGFSQSEGSSDWSHLSSKDGDLAPPGGSTEQTASLILDVDRDGLNDFVIGSRQAPGPSMEWYRRQAAGWSKYLIDDSVLNIEAGGAYADIDRDGDLDIVMGGDYQSNKVWWWENPYPNFDPETPWTRREIKNSGGNKHHDQMFGDFDGDGEVELVFWNQGAQALYIADLPSNPKATQPWPYTAIYTWSGDEHEGLAQADIDGDGLIDMIGGGRWFKYTGGTNYTPNVIDDSQSSSRAAAGQIVQGGSPEVVFVIGDGIGKAAWYEWDGNSWIKHDLLSSDVDHGHSLEVADLDGDGHLDIFLAEMRLDGANPDAKMWIFLGNGQGNFSQTEVASGFGNHESRVGDLDGDGDLDILDKPYNWDTPRVDIWLNSPSKFEGRWQRFALDEERPWRAIFVTAADLDSDGHKDVITGGWWYKNPGAPTGDWERFEIGSPLNNMAAVYDFDGDGDVDILGTGGTGSDANSSFYWARNDGQGNFTVLDNIQAGEGDFLQGVAVGRFEGQNLGVALSWHVEGQGVQMLSVPSDPSTGTWTWSRISTVSQDEALSAGDVDGDGDLDLLLGTIWLHNEAGSSWTPVTLFEASAPPDRNRLADINADGKLDAVVGYEAISEPGKLVWYQQGNSPANQWTEHLIADPSIIGPMSLDVADMDGDGDLDVVAGEHNPNDPTHAALFIFENVDGTGTDWRRHLIYAGDEHHDGAQVVDIDNDGDQDIISIGWTHDRVLLYENQAGSMPTKDLSLYLPNVTSNSSSDSPVASSTPAPTCLESGPRVLYTFEEGLGDKVKDHSGLLPPLDLTLPATGTAWLSQGGLAVTGPAVIQSVGPAQRLINSIVATGELTFEAWITPANLSQDGPARILTISGDLLHRNFTFGQGLWGDQPSDLFDVRLRTTSTDLNGQPSLSTPQGSAKLDRTQVVFTHQKDGASRVFLDGQEAASASMEGDLSNWNAGYKLALANELTGDRPWRGEFHQVAVYDCALTPGEVGESFSRGLGFISGASNASSNEEDAKSIAVPISPEESRVENDPAVIRDPSVNDDSQDSSQTPALSLIEQSSMLLVTGLVAIAGGALVLAVLVYRVAWPKYFEQMREMKILEANRCPSCDSHEISIFYELSGVPVHSVIMLESEEQALQYPQGDIRLGFCRVCGFISNYAFESRLQEYDSHLYEATQAYSPTFNAFHRRLAADLIERFDLRHKRILEIGCGQGDFLSLICQMGENQGIGFDPAFAPERLERALPDDVQIIGDFYSQQYSGYQVDLICCKMTLEHIQQTAEFVNTVRKTAGMNSDVQVFFQVPNARYVFGTTAFWDVYYEHCSYFSPGSLARLFRKTGFEVQDLWLDYDDQYLMIAARPAKNGAGEKLSQEEPVVELAQEVADFGRRFSQFVARWQEKLIQWQHAGRKTVLWGGGSKAVAFLTTLKIGRDQLEYVVDINPNKSGTYLAPYGQEVVAPQALVEYRPDIVIVMNPIYCQEIGRILDGLNLAPEILSIEDSGA